MARLRLSSPHVRFWAFVSLLAVAALTTVLCPALVLGMGPALMIFLLLVAGVRPGENALERLRLRRRRAAPRWSRGPRAGRPHVARVVRRVRQPLARALTTRPPPALVPVLS